MDSGILDADKISKGRSKWGEGNKVYTRRPKTTTKNAAVAATVACAADSLPTTRSGSPPTTSNNDQSLAVERVNLENRHALSPVVEVSDDHSVENQENGVVKRVVTVVDGRVRINIKAAKSKDEIVELKEAMKGELERVRSLAQKLEDKEAELTAFSTDVGVTDGEAYSHSTIVGVTHGEAYNRSPIVGVTDGEAYDHLQYSGNDTVDRSALLRVNSEMGTDYMDRRALMRINSEVGSVTNSGVRPFRQLSVSVMNNNHGVGEFVEKEKRTPKANQYYRNSDFLLGKDRLPPETNKRRKTNSGRKHSKESDYFRNNMFKNCNNLLQRLMKHKFGWVFNEPVNAKMLGLHDYHDIIKHPMDLGTIKSRLAQNFYKSPMEFAEDMRLTFRNAMTYNPKGQDVHVMAEQLSNIFEERWAVIESEYNPDLRYGMIYDAYTPTPTSRKVPHFAHAPSRMLYRSESLNLPAMTRQQPSKFVPTVRTPVPKKPKARDPNKRNMTYEEKQKLSTNLQSLPSEKLDSIVQIIKKNTSLTQHDEEIEVDIDSVDIETLWELDRFVTNYKKNLSKHKRKAALAQQAREEAGDVNRTMNPSMSIPEASKENNTNEKTLASTPLNQGGGGDNASSSSSSSSDSGSSSSDSDSDSSSEDGSDAGHSPRS